MRKRMNYRWKIMRMLSSYAGGVKRYWGILLLLSAVGVGLEFITPQIYRFFIDDVILKADLSVMPWVIAGYLTVYFIGIIAGYIKIYAKFKLVNTVVYRVRLKILHYFFAIPFADYEKISIGDLKMCIDDDTEHINAFAGSQTIDYFIACITIIVSAVTLISMNLGIAFFTMIVIPFTFWLDYLISNHEKVIVKERRQNQQKMSSWLHSSVQGWREIKALNLARCETRKFYGFLHKDMLGFAKWINFWTARVLIIPKIKDECFMQFGLYFIGGLLIISGKLRISDLLVFAVYYSLLSNAIKTVSTADADLQSNMPHTDRLLASLSISTGEENRGVTPDGSFDIVLEEVTFAYPNDDRAVIENINLKIYKGERVAIIGKSGSGKTTLLKLITGMLVPTSGTVYFSGVNLRDIDIAAMHKSMGIVMQENILFHTTIKENLLYGKMDATQEELVSACKKACIYDFIVGLPEQFNTIIGEKGIKLSGGQRQRIVLARMFLRDVDVFIFDEATSALDQHSESIVHDAIRNIAKDKTIIVVAHRESSIQLCDRIISLNSNI